MSIFFSFSEGIKSMTKARLATMLSISSITLTIILIGIFTVFSINLNNWINQVRQKIEMEVFLDDEFDGCQQPLLKIKTRKEYWTVEYVPKNVDPYDVIVFVS